MLVQKETKGRDLRGSEEFNDKEKQSLKEKQVT